MDTDQTETIAFLSNGASYGLPGVTVARTETHCSSVFLIADRAYKLKHPIAFSSVDYITLDRRAAACRAELALNRRMAPELYLGIRSIRRRPDGTLGFDGAGTILDWVVVMRRFDEADLFDRLTEARRLTPELLVALAEEIADFHEAAERMPGFGGTDGLRFAIERNRIDLLTVTETLDRTEIDVLHGRWLAVLEAQSTLLDARRTTGRVRRLHGDLRLANICLLDGRPTLFDAIEFSDALTCIDTLFDLAFVLMELVQRGLAVEAGILFNRYLDLSGDDSGLAALPLMLSVRAGTRAYALASATKRQRDPAAARQRAAAARSHLVLATTLLDRAVPRLVVLGGTPGSAKHAFATQLAAGFAPPPGARILSSETARRRLLSLPPKTRLGAESYDIETTKRVYSRLASDAMEILRAGYSVVVEASFARSDQRDGLTRWPAAAVAHPIHLWFGPDGAVPPCEADGWQIVSAESALPPLA